MLKLLLLGPALILVTIGLEGVYNGYRGRQSETLTCEQFRQSPPRALTVRLTNCTLDYQGAAYRESNGEVRELFLPARPAGAPVGQPAPVVVVTRAPAALAIAQRIVNETSAAPGTSVETMQKAAAAAGVTDEIRGLVRSGLITLYGSRQVLSGLSTPLAENVALVDLNATPDIVRPGTMLLGGLTLLLVALFATGRAVPKQIPTGNSADRAAILDRLGVAKEHPPVPAVRSPAVAPPLSHGTRLPQLMFLKLGTSDGLEAIESAPPLGTRAEVVARFRELLPDLVIDDRGRGTHRGPDHELSINLGPLQTVHTVTVDARGGTGTTLVRWLLDATGWRAFAPKTGRFVAADDLDDLARAEHTSAPPRS